MRKEKLEEIIKKQLIFFFKNFIINYANSEEMADTIAERIAQAIIDTEEEK